MYSRIFTAAAACAAVPSLLTPVFCSAQDVGVPTSVVPQSALGSIMNPAISLDGLFSASQFNTGNPLVFEGGHDPRQNGFNIQQVELTLNSNVDPYFRADANLVFIPGGVEIEEAYATTLGLPWGLQIKGGTFFTAFGRQNPIHPHAWSFVDKPLVLGRFFGGDGLRNPGAQISWLTPLPWFSEVTASLQNSTGETAVSFNPDALNNGMRTLTDGVALLRWSNFVSVTDEWLLSVGASFATGQNADAMRTRIYGGDVYLRYRKLDSLAFVTFTFESLWRDYETQAATASDWGWYGQTEVRMPGTWNRWFVGLRYEWVGAKEAPVVTTVPINDEDADVAGRWRFSPVISFFPSEFSRLRLQYNYDKPENFEHAQQVVSLQLEFIIGAHGAHNF